MEITLTIDNNLLVKASQLTGIVNQAALLKAGLRALISLEIQKRLTQKNKTGKLEESVSSQETFQAIMEISRQCSALPTQDSRSEDDILGYNNKNIF